MTYVINDKCNNCGDCEPACPAQAISNAGDRHVINMQRCIDCGACVDVCPADAIDVF